MEKTIEKFHPIITVEVADMDIKNIPPSKKVIEFLINKGYQSYEFKEGEILPHIVKSEPYKYDNILLLPDCTNNI
jgi:bifunctional pyridoxal-dependent enzyme with beta-cystathionase and maltose regulon repressor activities